MQLSRIYNCDVDELMRTNGGMELLKTGQIVQIPITKTNSSNEVNTPVKSLAPVQTSEITHTVKKGETFFSISRSYGVSITEIKRLNGIGNEELAEGRVLIIRKGSENNTTSTAPIPDKPLKETSQQAPPQTPPPSNEVKPEVKELKPIVETPTKKVNTYRPKEGGKPILQITESGTGEVSTEGVLENGRFYCLHKNAPIGTIVKATEYETGKHIYLKVIGHFSQAENPMVIIKISDFVTKKLGIENKPFKAELSYAILE